MEGSMYQRTSLVKRISQQGFWEGMNIDEGCDVFKIKSILGFCNYEL